MQQPSRGATEQESGKRKSTGKRKLSDQEEAARNPQNQQATISELLSRSHSTYDQEHHRRRHRQSSPTTKRPRLSPSPPRPPFASNSQTPSNGMYNFANQDSRTSGPFGQAAPGSHALGGPAKSRPFNTAARQSNFTPHTGAKKLVVKNLRTGSRFNQDSYFEKVWGQLDAALAAIFDGVKPTVSLEELYKGAENVCRQGRAAQLAKQLQDRCRGHVSGKLRDTLISRAESGDNIDALRVVVESWATWQSKLVCRYHPSNSQLALKLTPLLCSGYHSMDLLLSRSIIPPPL